MKACLIDFEEFPAAWPKWLREEIDEAYDVARWASIDALVHAMRTRVLTMEEEKRAHDLGDILTTPRSWSFRRSDTQRYYEAKELNDLWFQQRRLKALKKGILLS